MPVDILSHGNSHVLGTNFFYDHPVYQAQDWGSKIPSTGTDEPVTYPTHSNYVIPPSKNGGDPKPMWNWAHVVSLVAQIVILGVIVYLAWKDPKELGIMFRYYLMFVFGLVVFAIGLGALAVWLNNRSESGGKSM